MSECALERIRVLSPAVDEGAKNGLPSRGDGFDSRPRLQDEKNSPLHGGLFFISAARLDEVSPLIITFG